MQFLYRVYGYPHEFLHVLALWLIGRRAVQVTRTHVDIPNDLSMRQFVFVAGMPALVFGAATLACVLMLFSAANVGQAVLWFVAMDLFGLGAAGTVGDLMVIAARLRRDGTPPSDGQAR